MSREFKFEIKDHADSLKCYIVSLIDNLDRLKFANYLKNSDDKNLGISLMPGKYNLVYKYIDNKNIEMMVPIIVDYNESEKIYTLHHETMRHKDLYITVICNDRNEATNIIYSLVKNSIKYTDNDNGQINIRLYSSDFGWRRLSSRPRRTIDTIYMNHKEKSKLISDLDNFYNSQDLYLKFGIHYKRVYLLEGPPGTGKTSLVTAVASKYKKNISIMHFGPKTTDEEVHNAINSLNGTEILLLEDIDALFPNDNTNESKNMTSFSGLLNILDGVGTPSGIVIFMTTNHKDKLRDALKRPGRIDYILSMNLPGIDELEQMFNSFFPDQQTFKRFVPIIEKNRQVVTPAFFQKFLFDNIRNNNVVDKLEDFDKLVKDYAKYQHNMYL